MQRYVKFFLLILVIIPILTISPNGKSLFQKKAYVFGTIVDIQIYGESKKLATKASEEILSNFNNLHQLLHPWRKGLMFEINKAIQNEPQLLKYKSSLENFSKDISLMNNQNLKSSIKNSGVFLEFNIGKISNKNNLKTNVEKLLIEIKNSLVNNNSLEAKNIIKTIDNLFILTEGFIFDN